MATLTYNFTPDQQVWVITPNDGVKRGYVRVVAIKIMALSTEKLYYVQFDGETGATPAVEANIYDDVDLALAAYRTTLV